MGILYRLRCWILAVLREWQEYQEWRCIRRHGGVRCDELEARVREAEERCCKAWDELARESANLNAELDAAQARVRELEVKVLALQLVRDQLKNAEPIERAAAVRAERERCLQAVDDWLETAREDSETEVGTFVLEHIREQIRGEGEG